MKAAAALGLYAVALAAALGAGALAGSATGPIDVATDTGHADGDAAHGGGHSPGEAATPAGSAGLTVSTAGYTLVAADRLVDEGEMAFTITGPDGEPVQEFDEVHERPMHLIVASRDLFHFAHVHPELGADGRWTVDLPALPAGPYRAFADFRPTGGPPLTLGIDVVVPGVLGVPPPLETTRVSTIGDYEVTIDGDLEAGVESVLEVTVRHRGQVVTTAPYLGAGGHLVALRDGDLAYLHVHPLEAVPSGPVPFAVEVTSPGTYALFFDFLHRGEVRTARFVLGTSGAPAPPPGPPATSTDAADDHGDHTH